MRQFATVPTRLIGQRAITGVDLVPQPVSDSVLTALYKEPLAGEPSALTSLREDYQTLFTTQRMSQLLNLDLQAQASGNTPPLASFKLINSISSPVPTRFNSFESFAGPGAAAEELAAIASTPFRHKINQRLSAISLPWPISAEMVLNRDNGLTCGGCHSVANSLPVAPSTTQNGQIVWPRAVSRFIHVETFGQISPALTDFNLRWRAQLLQSFNASGGQVTAAIPSTKKLPTATSTPAEINAARDAQRASGGAFRPHNH